MQEGQGEFALTDRDFAYIKSVVVERTGIALSDSKRDMVYGRLARRLRRLGLPDFKSYGDLLRSGDEDELRECINALTTNLTSFFREPHHFTYLGGKVIPQLVRAKAAARRIRIWSAGCSTGEEPYSIAITLRESMPDLDRWDVKILATDLDSNVVAKAAAGVYTQERIKGMEAARVKKWFRAGEGEREGLVKVSETLRTMITFRALNLIDEWPMRGAFDVIFCRNVVIYFEKSTQRILFDRMADMLVPDGHLFIGHSESLFKVTERFAGLGNTIYRRCQ
jgi:chemotaxis protein methyltransferase CheR